MADDRNASISAYVNSLDWSEGNKAASAAALQQAAQQYGVSAEEIAGATGYKTQDVQNLWSAPAPAPSAPAPSTPQSNLTQEQITNIRSYVQGNMTDPGKIAEGMKQYGVSANDLAYALNGWNGLGNTDVQDWVARIGAQTGNGVGFGGNTSSKQGVYSDWFASRNAAEEQNRGMLAAARAKAASNPASTQSFAAGPAAVGSSGGVPTSRGVETAENRISGLLGVDANGNYSNQVVRQAADRALQAFAGRGLLNSSMAQQAAQEAAISKATEIATTDAGFINADLQKDKDRQFQSEQERIAFDRQLQQLAVQNGYDIDKLRTQYGLDTEQKNTDRNQTNEWNLQSSYRTQRQQADMNYNNAVNNINVSQMTPEQKQAAITAAAETRDAELATLNEVYAQAPSWKNEWSTVAVLTSESGIKSITSIPRLSAIVSDPAQPESTRAAARARITELQTTAAAKPTAPTGLIPANTNDQVGD